MYNVSLFGIVTMNPLYNEYILIKMKKDATNTKSRKKEKRKAIKTGIFFFKSYTAG
jgi:hypothetical protein